MRAPSSLDDLLAIEEIKQLKARRDHAVDTKDWATYQSLHLPEATSHAEGLEPWGSATEMTAAVSSRLEGITTSHHSHTPLIALTANDEATGMWSMEDNLFWKQGEEDHWYRGFGFYHEVYAKRDGRWLFKSRRLVRTHVSMSAGGVIGDARLRARRNDPAGS